MYIFTIIPTEEVECFADKFGMGYPIQWCVGLLIRGQWLDLTNSSSARKQVVKHFLICIQQFRFSHNTANCETFGQFNHVEDSNMSSSVMASQETMMDETLEVNKCIINCQL